MIFYTKVFSLFLFYLYCDFHMYFPTCDHYLLVTLTRKVLNSFSFVKIIVVPKSIKILSETPFFDNFRFFCFISLKA